MKIKKSSVKDTTIFKKQVSEFVEDNQTGLAHDVMHKKVFAYYYFMGLKHKKSWSHILTTMCSLNCFSFFINMNASVKPV